MENSTACPHKTKNSIAIWSSKYTPEHISGQSYNLKKKCTAIFIAELFTRAKIWKQSKCPLTDEWKKKMEYYSVIKREWNNAICSNMDGPGDYHAKWIKLERQRQIPYDITDVWRLKYDINELIHKKEMNSQTQRTDLREGWWRSLGLANASYLQNK